MNYQRIFSLSKKLLPNYKNLGSPTEIFQSIINNGMIKSVIGTNARYISITIMLFKKGLSEEEIHSLFEDGRFTFTVTTISERDPNEDCPQCGGDGKYDCDSCGGDGEITCNDCGGDGTINQYEDDEHECDSCSGDGYVNCDDCDANGQLECDYCDGFGSIVKTGHDEIENIVFLSVNQKLKDYFITHDTPVKISDEALSKIFNDEYTVATGKFYEQSSDYYDDFNVDDNIVTEFDELY